MSSEKWRSVVGFEGLYEVSDHARVRSIPRTFTRTRQGNPVEVEIQGRVLSQSPDKHGYLLVQLPRTVDGRQRNCRVRVNVLMLEAFIGPRPEGMVARHRNDVPGDNRLENLLWGTQSQNRHDSVRNGGHGYAKRTHCKNGHEFTPENTYIRTGGARGCRQCRLRTSRAYMRSEKGRARQREYMREYRNRGAADEG